MMQRQTHPIAPIFDQTSTALILGSFPSVKSREGMFFYHHPQNRFWQVLAAVFHAPLPQTIAEKLSFLMQHHVAVWDVIGSCEIKGSSDASIRDAQPTDLAPILASAPIRTICCNGATAWNLYQKYQLPQTGRQAVRLPSTSPANARFRLDDLISSWQAAVFFDPDIAQRAAP